MAVIVGRLGPSKRACAGFFLLFFFSDGGWGWGAGPLALQCYLGFLSGSCVFLSVPNWF